MSEGSLGVDLDERGNVVRDDDYATSVDRVFVAGDAGRGQPGHRPNRCRKSRSAPGRWGMRRMK